MFEKGSTSAKIIVICCVIIFIFAFVIVLCLPKFILGT